MTSQGTPRIGAHALLNSFMNLTDLAIFWKDRDRRFVGANQNFLDFYGFDSVEDIIGKTDEDMGWHLDPEPYQMGEYEVLNEGIEIKDDFGNCIAHGMIRDIICTEKPIYDGDHIVGLIGYFKDITEQHAANRHRQITSYRDEATGLLNIDGLTSMLYRFQESYIRRSADAAVAQVRITNINAICSEHADDPHFRDHLLHCIGKRLNRFFGNICVLGITDSEDFVAVEQFGSDTEIDIFAHNLSRAVLGITSVGDVNVALEAKVVISKCSQVTDSNNAPSELIRMGYSKLAE